MGGFFSFVLIDLTLGIGAHVLWGAGQVMNVTLFKLDEEKK